MPHSHASETVNHQIINAKIVRLNRCSCILEPEEHILLAFHFSRVSTHHRRIVQLACGTRRQPKPRGWSVSARA